ncbi:Valine--tRNA ligase [Planktothrix agardhii]|jgi:valyl-tRNA synthetase|uniref:Valine--tRNA ligase n=1 Tax=Planktothrix agardhii TaxID=1160 RepID=A0A1J1JFY3_PLAAG|nr:valine--tRNA ligase [Planktothrix agardhii]MBG0745268.1 valine--tRNA ligase [Planktothrix agardhii KL2]MCF3577960.1 valine--tRNA ligase [Planktothrix agardhii 1812]MCF3579080.1 valine--tRNA ligase [Planktothrix agardhii 1811]MCF3623211.1 valine--tRNA ligase [Planktothrix agardhii 1801]CAD5941214.1 Valine--tRNA ligase [Planktothrix agardhii]
MTATTPTQATKYEPFSTEAKWQQYWEAHQVFKADPNQPGEPYCIMIPPPNVTGNLHIGHAVNNSLIDALIRYHRMKGYNALYLPGMDHASIAVQTILERQLKAEGKTRDDLGREKFLQRAWEWKQESGGTIVNQLRRLGVSCDWTRERFTLDEGLSKAVLEAFIRLYEDGLIYRGKYLVNWCPASQSAVSDLEVENKEVDGNLWHFRYPLSDGSGYVEVATTRPETMLGDTAVAVNPNDIRYKDLIGKTVILPIIKREIPIIGDDFVDPNFGTGCVKVTPAHDPNDFQMGQRHQLPMINIMNQDGSLNENAGPFAGQDRFVARKNLIQFLKDKGFLVKIEDYKHTVPYSDRGKVPVEPLLSTQWFVKIRPLADKALNCLDQQDSPVFVPDRWTKVYRDWLVKLDDWCISRQLWWGHQIPAWYAVSETGGKISDNTPFVVARTETEAQEKAIAKFGETVILEQDPDVLDTWFSSGLWPFSTLGWPEETLDLSKYYPTSTLSTGFDIIFFWVARMTMMGAYFTDKMPFKTVYIHGLIRDENGKKMSKSAGNGIDPLLLIDKYGTDAVRFTLMKEVIGAGQDIRLEYNRETDESASVEASRNFANKLWNASRFVMMNLDGKSPKQLGEPNINQLELSDKWILSRFNQTVKQTHEDMDNYGIGEAAKGIYEFIWGDFCDWYIELAKPRLQGENNASRQVSQQTLAYVLEGILKLLHPFMPHITEEIWHSLTQTGEESCLALQPYPVVVEDNVLDLEVQRLGKFVNDPDSILGQSITILFELPEVLGGFFKQYQKPLILTGLFFVAFLTVKCFVAALNALNELPLVSTIFELIGMGYSGWFVYRYLLKASQREELGKILEELKTEFIGSAKADNNLEIPNIYSEIYQEQSSEIISIIDPKLEVDFELIIGAIRTVRNLRAEADIKPKVKVNAILQSESTKEQKILKQGQTYIQELGKVEALTITEKLTGNEGQSIAGVVGTVQVLMPLAGVVDLAAFQTKLQKKLAKVEKEIQGLQRNLNNSNFVNRAEPEVVENTRNSLAEAQKQAEILQQRLSQFN